MQYMDGVVGNSSSGLIEVPSFRIGTINIGDRQKGRIKAASVIDCDTSVKEIQGALKKLFSKSFQEQIKLVENPYGNGGTSEKILEVIRAYPLNEILKKCFYNITHTISD